MIGWTVVIIVGIALIYILSFFIGAALQLILNTILITVLVLLIRHDLKNRAMLRYYLYSTIVTVIIFIFGYRTYQTLTALMKKAFLVEITMAFLLIYIFAYIIQFIYLEGKNIIKALKRPKKK